MTKLKDALGIDVRKQPGRDWDASRQILHSPDFLEFLRIALVQIAIAGNSDSARIRAIEMLMQMGGSSAETMLTDVPTDVLEVARVRAQQQVLRLVEQSRPAEDERKSDTASGGVLF